MIFHIHDIINKQQNESKKVIFAYCSNNLLFNACYVNMIIDLVHSFFLLFWALGTTCLYTSSTVCYCAASSWIADRSTTLKLSARAQQGPFTEYRIQRDTFTIIINFIGVHLLTYILEIIYGNVHLCIIPWHYLYDTAFTRCGRSFSYWLGPSALMLPIIKFGLYVRTCTIFLTLCQIFCGIAYYH